MSECKLCRVALGSHDEESDDDDQNRSCGPVQADRVEKFQMAAVSIFALIRRDTSITEASADAKRTG